MSISSRILKNVFSNWVGYALSIVIAFFISPFVVHKLGNSGYGMWILVGSLTGHMGILDFGLRPAIVKFVSRYDALGDTESVNRVINTTLATFTIIAAVVILLSILLAMFADRFFEIPVELLDEFRVLVLLVGFTLALGFPFGVFSAVISALQRFDINNLFQVLALLCRTALIIILLNLGYGVVAMGIVVLVAGLVEFSLKTQWCLRKYPGFKLRLKSANFSTLKSIAGFSTFVFIIAISVRLSFQTDSIVIGAFMSAGAITFFAIANNLVTYMTSMLTQASVTITPVASALDAKEDIARLRRLLHVGTKYCLTLALPVGIAFLIFGERFIELWMGPGYGKPSGEVLFILTIAYIGYLSQLPTGSIFYGRGKVKALAFLNLGMAVANIVLSVILVRDYGIVGVAIGTAVPLAVYGYIVLPLYVCRELGVNVAGYILRSYAIPVLAGIPYTVVLYLLHENLQIGSLPEFGAMMLAALVVYVLAVIYVVLEKDHKEAVWAQLERLKARIIHS
jgi:O-antigen/teichoic acid export membrane protein